jgi:hypothetical protein
MGMEPEPGQGSPTLPSEVAERLALLALHKAWEAWREDIMTESGWTPLHTAAFTGDLTRLRELLSANPELDNEHSRKRFSLMYVALLGNDYPEIIQELIAYQPDKLSITHHARDLLELAVEAGRVRSIKILLEQGIRGRGGAILAKITDRLTPGSMLPECRREIAELLLAHGFTLDWVIGSCVLVDLIDNPLRYAALAGDYPEVKARITAGIAKRIRKADTESHNPALNGVRRLQLFDRVLALRSRYHRDLSRSLALAAGQEQWEIIELLLRHNVLPFEALRATESIIRYLTRYIDEERRCHGDRLDSPRSPEEYMAAARVSDIMHEDLPLRVRLRDRVREQAHALLRVIFHPESSSFFYVLPRELRRELALFFTEGSYELVNSLLASIQKP